MLLRLLHTIRQLTCWRDSKANLVSIVQNQIGQILNATQDTAWKVNEIRNLANKQAAIAANNTNSIGQVLQLATSVAQKLVNIVNTLSNLKNASTSTAGVVDG